MPDLPAIPLPAFRQPHRAQLDPLNDGSPQPSSPHDESPGAGSPEPSSPDDAPPPPIESSPERPAGRRTRTSGTGDPGAAGKALAGLLVIVAGLLGASLARSGRRLRQPTPPQVDDIATPIGAILARHLPTDLLGPDLADLTQAAAATHKYVLDPAGPLITRTATATVAYPDEETN